MKIKFLILFISLVHLTSCASLYMKKGEHAAKELVQSLNDGQSLYSLEMSEVPFVFHGEIILSSSTLLDLWGGLVESGFTIKDPVINSIEPLLSSDYILFSPSWEMEAYFNKNIPSIGYKININGIDGEMLLLLKRLKNGKYKAIGLKVASK